MFPGYLLHAVKESHGADMSVVDCHPLVQHSSWKALPLCLAQDPRNNNCNNYDNNIIKFIFLEIRILHCHLFIESDRDTFCNQDKNGFYGS